MKIVLHETEIRELIAAHLSARFAPVEFAADDVRVLINEEDESEVFAEADLARQAASQ